ncbi:MAG TPA: hypothetical protein VF796_12885 [Humisphaera sp.]
MLVPIPALVAILLRAEELKGKPLTKAEVTRIRDECVCMTMTSSQAVKMAESRGYVDIDSERCWEEWRVARKQLVEQPAKRPKKAAGKRSSGKKSRT